MRTLRLATFCAGLLTMLKYTYRYDNFFSFFSLQVLRQSQHIAHNIYVYSPLFIMFAILTFAISVVDILTVHSVLTGRWTDREHGKLAKLNTY